jgi:cysteinyl-tRNA synthetase
MSLLSDCIELEEGIRKLRSSAARQQYGHKALIDSVVWMHQKHRLAQNYEVSDELRSLLSEVGVEIIQGTAAYAYDKIPEALRGRQFDDTWRFKDDR